ncbi:hypothetical protein [Methanobrevibacter sp.]|uniref:hypothetical protein n=1 Tax=Methanobrevibacter sp. TaxID=66852 RepID=UPI002E784FE2|nr:hypothetical protein [Methanobrevibacter sp.]MEE1336914.1 hypothetical protein [Methanobrevibacter sp.]
MATKKLFKVDCNNWDLWNLYLNSLPEDINPIFIENRRHDCFACERFFKKVGNVVAVDEENYEIITLFGCETHPDYEYTFNKLDDFVKQCRIEDIFKSYDKRIGEKCNQKMLEDGQVINFNHFYIDVPEAHIGDFHSISDAKTDRYVLESSTKSISINAVETVLELIESNNLYRGNEWYDELSIFKEYLEEYEDSQFPDENIFFWINSIDLGPVISRIKNRSIGTLLLNITEGMPLDNAVEKYEEIVSPANYKRPKPVFTKKMIEKAEEKITELGFGDSIARRFAVMEDLSVNDILFANRDVTPQLQDNENLFDKLKDFASKKRQNYDKVQEIPLDSFIENVLPNAQEVELYLDYSLRNNFMSLIAPVNKDAPSMFKWDNLFSWSYKNNLADSLMKERVKSMGGDVDVDLRFSIQWNDTGEWDKNDLDAHCTEPDGNEIYYHKKKSNRTGGWLDVDIIDPEKNKPAVENIRFKNKHDMIPGEYLFRVHQYTYRGGDWGFQAEIEFDGKINAYSYPFKINHKNYVDVAKVILDKDYNFTLKNMLESNASNITEWGLTYDTFVPVSLICYSPNYWGDNEVGNKHIFFILKDCVSDDKARPWFNEFLINELNEHKRVMEGLASVGRVEESDNQLSGIGFSFTQRNKVTLKVKSENIERVINVVI